MIKQAVILAGGFGKRLAPFTDENPKPMYPIEGVPFLERLIQQVKEFGIKDIVVLLGYKAEKVQGYFGDGIHLGVHIRYKITPVEYETGARLRDAVDLLEKHFLLMYCDNYCPIDVGKLYDDYIKNQAWIQLTVYSNEDQYTKDNILASPQGKVECYDKRRITANLQGVDIGYAIINKKVMELLAIDNCNFEATIYPQLVESGRLYATITHHRYYSIGSWERIELTKKFFQTRKIIFLDRDGTLNQKAPKACYIESPDEFVWLEGAKEAVRLLKSCGYEIYIVTNQPGIARGNLTEKCLEQIHQKMLLDLEACGGSIDDIYYCPHNWDEGCFCRKPRPGMLYQAQREHSFDLTKCVLVGDDERDIEAGMAAGCQCYQVTDQRSLVDIVKELIE